MNILAHRGLWTHDNDQNSLASLKHALDLNFGVETDIRDLNGSLVISHDMPNVANPLWLEDFLAYYKKISCSQRIALNVKSDGLQDPLQYLLKKYEITNYFVFDMSVPDTLKYIKSNIITYARKSDIENNILIYGVSQGIWMDEMLTEWIGVEDLRFFYSLNKPLCVVSSELHGREKYKLWEMIRDVNDSGYATDEVSLCTDLPLEAADFFRSNRAP